MEEKTDIKAKTIKVDTGKGNTIKVTMSYGAFCALRRSQMRLRTAALRSITAACFQLIDHHLSSVDLDSVVFCDSFHNRIS